MATEHERAETHVRMPMLAAFAATRVMAGFGLGLLLASKFGSEARRRLGLALLSGGIASTVPLAWKLRHSMHCPHEAAQQPS